LAAGVAHEINNPLAALIANLECISDSLVSLGASNGSQESVYPPDEWLRTEIKSPLDDARDAAKRVRFIVRDLKTFSRPQTEELKTKVDVEALIESSLRMAWNEIRHRARLVKNYGGVPLVLASEARLGQVFLNLIVNAAQAMEEGFVHDNELMVKTKLEGEHVIVEVTDSGAGIPPQNIHRVFEAFYTTKAVGIGTGLGLAICHRIITDMAGGLTVESREGVGTTFRVSIPIGPSSEASAPSFRPKLTSLRARVLLVDDEELVLRALQRILKEHDVVTTSSAKLALSLCAAGTSFDLILCDLMMPAMTGMELHQELVRIAPEQAKRMVFLTGGAFTEKARSFLTEVAREHIEKPFEAANLRAIVQSHLRANAGVAELAP
jgi:CheY-like chemotaxis protein